MKPLLELRIKLVHGANLRCGELLQFPCYGAAKTAESNLSNRGSGFTPLRNPLKFKKVPRPGLEPGTCGLRVHLKPFITNAFHIYRAICLPLQIHAGKFNWIFGYKFDTPNCVRNQGHLMKMVQVFPPKVRQGFHLTQIKNR